MRNKGILFLRHQIDLVYKNLIIFIKYFLLFISSYDIVADGSALHDEGVIIHEEKYSSVLRRSGRALCLRRDLPYRLHQGRAEGRNLQQVPPVLHGPSEAGRQRRTSRSLQEALRSVRTTLNSNKTRDRKRCGPVFVYLVFCPANA